MLVGFQFRQPFWTHCGDVVQKLPEIFDNCNFHFFHSTLLIIQVKSESKDESESGMKLYSSDGQYESESDNYLKSDLGYVWLGQGFPTIQVGTELVEKVHLFMFF